MDERMSVLSNLIRTSVGRKLVMAATGLMLFGFVVVHMLGNLQTFMGREALNGYAALLQKNAAVLWSFRLGLALVLAVHVTTGIVLAWENRAARPERYEGPNTAYGSSLPARTMVMSGVMVGAFVVYHVLHFTVKVPALNFTGVDFAGLRNGLAGQPDVYGMVLCGFRSWPVSAAYVVAMGFLALHASHGLAAAAQSLGLKQRSWSPGLDHATRVVALVLLLGYISIPLAVLGGMGDSRGVAAAQSAGGEEAAP
ncbi:MAG: succinate dehydrogenase cytochrome b subunit [Verrucomicrobia bacterium]|nr:succinate dehydrogenase cytochrome b subunit [Verrucomicrobiota bacterium]